MKLVCNISNENNPFGSHSCPLEKPYETVKTWRQSHNAHTVCCYILKTIFSNYSSEPIILSMVGHSLKDLSWGRNFFANDAVSNGTKFRLSINSCCLSGVNASLGTETLATFYLFFENRTCSPVRPRSIWSSGQSHESAWARDMCAYSAVTEDKTDFTQWVTTQLSKAIWSTTHPKIVQM